MTTAWEVISEWLAMANNANRHNLTMTLVDKTMLLVAVVVTNRRPRQHSLLLQVAAAEEAEDSRRSRERVFK